MRSGDDYVEFLCELLGGPDRVSARRMFGGHGIYHDGLMFGLVADGRLYLKVDAHSRAQFEAAGCQPFVYAGKGKPISMSYFGVPDDALDSAEAMSPWSRLAADAALRKASVAPARSPRRKRAQRKVSPKRDSRE